MCLILFAHRADPRYPLVLAANRDEFYSRPTRYADFWQDPGINPSLLAGKDLFAGGTWLGMTKSGRFAAVTNIRDPSQLEKKSRSRGELPLAFLNGSESAADYSAGVKSRFGEYAGFNLLVGDTTSLYYLNNHEHIVQQLEPGIYGLSNGLLNSNWPKVNKGRQRIQAFLQSDCQGGTDALMAMMSDSEQAADAELPGTGIPLALERKLSAAFIQNPERQYGTLCSTAILLEAGGSCHFGEQNYDDHGLPLAAQLYQFKLGQ